MSCQRVGYSVKKKLQDTDIYKVRCFVRNIICLLKNELQDRASQIAAIEQTFEAAKQPVGFNKNATPCKDHVLFRLQNITVNLV